MRLYLSSHRLGNNPEELVRLVGPKKHAGLILNSLDGYAQEGRDERLEREHLALQNLGFSTEELDLRKYFDNKETLKEVLQRFNLVWLRGGNSFVLKRAMEQSGFDTAIKELLEKDALAYGGFSAGSVVAGRTLKGIEFADDPNVIPPGYEESISWEGLGLLDYSIAPHYKSDHPESEAMNKVVEYFEEHHIPYKTLRDGQVIIIESGQERIVG